MVVLHDPVSPHVAAGLRALAAKGWNVMAYQTAQVGCGRAGNASTGTPEARSDAVICLGFQYPVPRRLKRPPMRKGENHAIRVRHDVRRGLGHVRVPPSPAAADDAQVARGRYLVTLPFLTNWRVWAFL
jgi:hypothetical protein